MATQYPISALRMVAAEADAITDGTSRAPWSVQRFVGDGSGIRHNVKAFGSDRPIQDPYLTKADAEFIAAARTMLPRLVKVLGRALTEIERLQMVTDAAFKLLQEHQDHHGLAESHEPDTGTAWRTRRDILLEKFNAR
jgi:hypothetical protein